MANVNENLRRLQAEQEWLLLRLRHSLLKTYNSAFDIAGVKKAIADGNDSFFFSNNYTANKAINRQLSALTKQMDYQLLNSVEKSWEQGKNSVSSSLQSISPTDKAEKEMFEKIRKAAKQSSRDNAAKAFYNEKRGGFSLSERVWNLAGNAKKEIEIILQNGIKEGKSADEIQKSLQGYLNEPDKLFRRVKNKQTGNLEWSKAAQKYHPGQGVYRSAYKNLMRLARTEIKAANCEAVWQSMQTNPLITGYRVVLSNNHTTLSNGKKIPLKDICDDLQGAYPKSFKFRGWHPQCRCEMIPIMATSEERKDLYKKIFDGKRDEWKPKQVADVPDGFKQWVEANKERQKSGGNVPYFVRDNFKGGLLSNGLRTETIKAVETPKIDPIQQQLDQLQPSIAAIKQIANEWGLNTYIVDDALAKRNPQGVINAISEMRNRVNVAMNELKMFVTDAAETIKQAKQANIDAMDMVNALSEINADKRDWIMSKAAYKQVLTDLKAKILAKSNGLSKITAPEWSYKPDSPKLSPRQRLENLLDNLEHYHGTSISASGYIAQSRQLIADGATDRVLEFELETWKKWKNIMMGEAKPCYQSINHLSELRSIKISDIPNEWRKAYNEAINTINQNDFTKNGYKDVYSNIEKAYNIYKLSKSDIVRKIGIDKISPNMPYNILTEYVKKIPGMMDCLPSKAFFDSLNEFVPLVSLKSGAHFSPTYKYVNISLSDSDNINRMSKSAWYRKGLFYHEFGHAFDHQIKLKKDSDLILTYKNWQADILKDNGVSLENIVKNKISKFNQDFETKRDVVYKKMNDLQKQGKNDESKRLWTEFLKEADLHEAKALEFNEQLGAFTDCLQAAVKGHRFISPRGHDVKYFSEDKQLAEFIAHCSENYWGNNPIFKEIAPQLYEQMQNIIKKKMAKL